MRAWAILRDECASAGAEFALILPMLVVLLFGGFEAGNFVWQQHKLTEAVRDGARFASRLNIADLCDGAADKAGSDAALIAATNKVKFYTRTGQFPSGNSQTDAAAVPRVWNWTSDSQVGFDPGCGDFVSTGLYSALTDSAGNAGQAGPLVTVSGSVPYRSLFLTLGFDTSSMILTARSRAAVIGL